MEDAHTIILPAGAAGDDGLGVRQIFELFVAAAGPRWAELEIREWRSGNEQTLKIGERSNPSVTIELEIDDDTRAILSIAGEVPPSSNALDLLAANIGRELHRLRLLAESALLRGAIEATSAAVLLFGPAGNILFANGAADELISKQTEEELTVDRNGEGPQPLFRVLVTEVGHFLEGVRKQPRRDRFVVSDGTELTSEILLLETGAQGLGRVVLAVLREIGRPPDHLVGVFAAHHRLSPREREVLRLLVQGHDTAGLADRLGISPHTVRDHLKNVFRKTSTRSRSELLSAVAGAGNHVR
jgi:DNA-binding CsgD family transcriptional regulator/PAS domain-containing protein